jgi:predicted acetyltransferase
MSPSDANITLCNATPDDLPRVKNLVPYYIYDMSEHMGWPCTADGRFDGCNGMEKYWSDAGKHAFMLRVGDDADGEIAGFVLVLADNAEADVDFSITEFLVLRKFRRRGVGERVARELFQRFRGRWKVEQLAANTPAVAFWTTVITRFTGGRFERGSADSECGSLNVLRFNSGNDAAV